MKLFKSLLIAPASLGLLAPISAIAGEANLNDISKFSDLENIELTNAFVNEDLTNDSPLLAGGEGLVEGPDGGFQIQQLLLSVLMPLSYLSMVIHLQRTWYLSISST